MSDAPERVGVTRWVMSRTRAGVWVLGALAATGVLVGVTALVGAGPKGSPASGRAATGAGATGTRTAAGTPTGTATMTTVQWLDSLPGATSATPMEPTVGDVTPEGRLTTAPSGVTPDVELRTARGLLLSWDLWGSTTADDEPLRSLGWLPPGADEVTRVDTGDLGPVLTSPDGDRYAYSVVDRTSPSGPRLRLVVRDAADDTVVAEHTSPGERSPLLGWNAAGLVLQSLEQDGLVNNVPLLWTPGSGRPRPVDGWPRGEWIVEDGTSTASGTDLVVVHGRNGERTAAVRPVTGGVPDAFLSHIVSLSRPDRWLWEGVLGGISPDGRYVLDVRDGQATPARRGVVLVSLASGEVTPLVPRAVRLGGRDGFNVVAWDDDRVTLYVHHARTADGDPQSTLVECTVPAAQCRRVG